MDQETQNQISAFLPDALAAALTSYEVFARKEIDMEPKSFTAHHTACKVAIAHIELLLKLARRMMDQSGTGDDTQLRLRDMIARAQNELDHYTDLDEIGEEHE